MGLLGGITRALFGGSKETSKSQGTSESGNKAYDFLMGAYGDQSKYTGQAGDAISSLLGLGGSGDTSGFDNYRNSSGYNFIADQGQRGIVGSAAAKGLLNSGSTAKALVGYNQNLASTYLNQYLEHLFNLSNVGLQSGSILSDAGKYSTSQQTSQSKGSKSTGGLGKAIGAGLAIFSDRRLKENIEKLYERDDGLGVYSYNYKGDSIVQTGVMADEVAFYRPDALGPVVNGYMTVNYGEL